MTSIEPYKSMITIILLDFSTINNEVLHIGEMILNLLRQGIQQLDLLKIINPAIDELVAITDTYCEHLLNLQDIINQNDITFTRLKQIDNDS